MTDQMTVEIASYLKKLFPICRSLTGEGNRQTLQILQELIPLKITEIPTGTKCYDWVVPQEWQAKSAWIRDSDGKKICDFADHNLHLVSYSTPVKEKMTFDQLKSHLHTLPDLPHAIPYRTSYYKKDWGFCLTHETLEKIDPQKFYEVLIDAKHFDGSLTLADFVIPGRSSKEILFSTYFCHPSMANDNLSGVVLGAFLARELSRTKPHYTYRFVFIPETIGAVAYASLHEETLKKDVLGGLILSNVGGPGRFGFKESFNKEHFLNHLIQETLELTGKSYNKYPFDIHGSDERQYSSQGFRINTPSLHKDKYYEFPEYHTSLDNLDLVKPEYLAESLKLHLNIVGLIEENRLYKTCEPHGEIMLGRHGLYPQLGGAIRPGQPSDLDARLWLHFYADGHTDLVEMSKKTGITVTQLARNAREMVSKGVLKSV